MIKKLAILKNSNVLSYSALFNLIIPLFLCAEYSIHQNFSPFDLKNVLYFVTRYGYLLVVALVVNFHVLKISKYAPILAKVFYFLSVFELILILLIAYNKFFFIANGLWIIAIFYFYYIISS